MILNVKSFMATIMAAILIIAVVLPIASAMVDLSAEKIYTDNAIESGEFRMTEASGDENPRLAVIDHSDGVQLSVNGERREITDRTVIFSDSFVIEFVSGYFKFYYNDADAGNGYYTSKDGDYVAVDHQVWSLYKYTEDSSSGTSGKTSIDDLTLVKVPAVEKPIIKADEISVMDANIRTFGSAEVVKMAADGMDMTKAVNRAQHGHYSWCVYPDDAGELLHADAPVYVDSGSTIYVAGASVGTDGRSVLRGTLADMDVVHSFSTVNPGDIKCTYTATDYSNELTAIKYKDGDTQRTITDFVVPLKYTSDKSAGIVGTLVTLAPLMLVVGLIIGVAGAFVLRNRSMEDF